MAREELAVTEAWEDVLEVRRRGGKRPDRDRAQWAVPDEEREAAGNTASGLEGAGRNVAVRDRVPERVQDRPEQEGRRS
jgi:hypothetical protein